MKRRKPSLDVIDRDLRKAAKILNATAAKIRDADFSPKRNVYRIGHALADIFDIQNEIYPQRPDLLPNYLADTAYGRAVLSNKRVERTAVNRRRPVRRRRGGRSTGGRSADSSEER